MAEDSPSRARIAQAFDAAAAYDAYAVVQRQVAAWLAERIVAVAPPRPRVLEVGCGTGFLTQAAWPRLDRPEWLMTDIAPEMLARGRAQMPDLCARVMDGERPDLAGEAPFDLIVSSLAVQWFSDLEGGLQRLAALPYAALPIGTAVALRLGVPLIYPRKETKAYGTRAAVEGVFEAGETAVMLDDLATTGGSKFEAAEKLEAAGLQVRDVVVLIDRQSGAREQLAARGLRLHAVFTLTELLNLWEAERLVSPQHLAAVRRFLAA